MKKWVVLSFALFSVMNLRGEEVFIPHLTAENTAWGSFIQADNLAEEQQVFTLTLFRDGAQIFEEEYTIAKFERKIINLSEVAAEGVCGWIRFQSPNLLFRLSYESYVGGGLAEFALNGTVSKELSFLFSDFSTRIEWKGIAIANLGETTALGTLYAMGQAGVLDHTEIEVGPKTRIRGVHSTYFPALTFSEVKSFVLIANSPLFGITISGDSPSGKLLFTQALPITNFTPETGVSYLGTWSGEWQSTEDTEKNGTNTLKVLTQNGDAFTGTLDIFNTDCGDIIDLEVSGTVVEGVFDFEIGFMCVAFPVVIHFYEGELSQNVVTGKYEQTLSGDFHDRGTFTMTKEN